MNVYSIFIHNCQNLEATKISFSRWMDKLWYIQTMKYHSVLTRNDLSSHEKTGRKLKGTLSEGKQSEMATYCMVSIIWHFGKGKTMETVKRSVVARSWWGWGGRGEEVEHRGSSGQWKYSLWYHHDEYMLLNICPNPHNVQHQECTKVNYWLWMIMMCRCRFISLTNVPVWWGILLMGKAMHG